MRFTSLTLLSVFLITFVSAIPAADKYKHFSSPGCPTGPARSCHLLSYCQTHRDRGDIFTTRGYLKSRDAPEPENLDLNLTNALSPSLPSFFTTRDVIRVQQCGLLSSVASREVSYRFRNLVIGMRYDLTIDYPYDGATKAWVRLCRGLDFNATLLTCGGLSKHSAKWAQGLQTISFLVLADRTFLPHFFTFSIHIFPSQSTADGYSVKEN